MKRANLKRLLRPRHIAFIGGVSSTPGIEGTLAAGFSGPVWSVNPNHERIAGLDCYPTVADLPEPPDASFIWVPRAATIDVVAQLAAIGAGGAICYAAGFAEIPGGAGHQDALIDAAGDFAAMGPNCHGMVNFLDHAGVWPIDFADDKPKRGPALVAQSGNFAINMMYNQRAMPFSYVISTGNEAVIDSADIIETLLDDDRVSAIGLYIEAIRNIASFSKAAARALQMGIPLVALKAGKSEGARRAAMTHTGSLSGADDAYEALFDRLAITRADNPEMFLEQIKALSIVGPLAGRRFAVMTCSGGEAALVSDYAEAGGIELPEPTATQQEALRKVLPQYANITNPLDYNTALWGQRKPLERAFTTIMSENCNGALLVLDYLKGGTYGTESDIAIDALIAASKTTGVPAFHACSLSESITEAAQNTMIDAGIAPLQGLETALAAAAACVRYGALRRAYGDRDITLPPVVTAPDDAPMLPEHEAKSRLAAYGIEIPPGRAVAGDGVADAAAELGFPVVLKALDGSISHKTEAGAVQLDLSDGAAVAAAAADMTARLGVTRFLVEAMIDDVVCELIIGINHDPTLGSVLVIGSGGVLVEIIGDSRTLLLPTDRETVTQALECLKASALIAGYRGKPAGDRDAVINAVMAVARFAEDHRGRLVELDINPLMVRTEGAVAADALIKIATE